MNPSCSLCCGMYGCLENENGTRHCIIREAITEEKQLFCGHLPEGGGGLTNSVPFGVILVCVCKLLTYYILVLKHLI